MSDLPAETDPTEIAETRGRRLPRVTAALVGLAFVAAAVAITVVEPGERQTNAPFVTNVTALNEKVTTRQFDLTVTDVALADRLTSPAWIGKTDGVWLVVDVTYAARFDRTAILGTMTIGDSDYSASSRVEDAQLVGTLSDPGLAWADTLVFELPRSALKNPDAKHAVVQIAASIDPRLDGVVQAAFDLTQLPHQKSLVVSKPGRVTG